MGIMDVIGMYYIPTNIDLFEEVILQYLYYI